MKISFLLYGIGYSGGSNNLYRFMDKLTERNYEVYAVLPEKAIKWEIGLSTKLIHEIYDSPKLSVHLFLHKISKFALYNCLRAGWKVLKLFPPLKNGLEPFLDFEYTKFVRNLTKGLLANWPESDITVAGGNLTAYSAFALMDKTVPLYYIQHFEELFFPDQLSQKFARLTYYMPLVRMTGGKWIQKLIKQKTGYEPYLLNPGFDHINFFPGNDIKEKYSKYNPLKIVSYGRIQPCYGWQDSVDAMRIVYSELGEDSVEWKVFYLDPKPPAPKDVKVIFVEDKYKDLAKLYSDSHICVWPYWYVGFPGSLLESMACGTATIASGLGIEEIVTDGVNGLAVTPKNPRLLADAIIRLAKDSELAYTLAENGILTAKKFNWDKATDELEMIMKKALKEYRKSNDFSEFPDLINGNIFK